MKLADLIQGNRELLVPMLFERTDGVCLLYPGLVHNIHGESESGKSLTVQGDRGGLPFLVATHRGANNFSSLQRHSASLQPTEG